ncbi:MAG: helix-turn-helix transcriptional regulator [Saprospiraceae bacterium]|nr:helix-turn-helix transcriptional regulator [Saprospiraceae bacterium]
MKNSTEKQQAPPSAPSRRERLQQALPHWIKNYSPVIDFAYTMDALRGSISAEHGMAAALGYEALPERIEQLLHPDEQRKIIRLIRRIKDFVKIHGRNAPACTFVLSHRLLRQDGAYLRVFRFLQPDQTDSDNNLLSYHCYCVDVSRFPLENAVSFDLRFAAQAPFNIEEALRFFQPILDEEHLHFTERELEVLREWAANDLNASAAHRLGIKSRTLETHLSNMRRKLGVRRTVDVVLYARERGWV